MASKPRVLFVTRRWPPVTGGMERFAFDLYNILHKKTIIKLLKWGKKSQLYIVIIWPIFFIRSCHILLTKKIDILHMQDGVMSSLGYVLSKIFNKPYVVVVHGLDVTYENPIFKLIILRTIAAADKVISISEAAKQEAIIRGVAENKVEVIPLGITDELKSSKSKSRAKLIAKYQLPRDSKILASVGRLVERKGVDWFLNNVFKELASRDRAYRYLIVGDGPQRQKIKETIKLLSLEDKVMLLGRVDEDTIKAVYNGSDIFVMPNITVVGDMEGFGRVLLEAVLCETTVVASGIEGIKDAIQDGKNGHLLKEKDVDEYISTITELFQVDRNKFARRARKYSLEKFSWDKVSDKYIEEYEKVINDRQ